MSESFPKHKLKTPFRTLGLVTFTLVSPNTPG